MSETIRQPIADFELPNVGVGPNPFRLSSYAKDHEVRAIVLLLQRDYHCPKCREQVQEIASRYDEFRDQGARIVSILPESEDQAQNWQSQYDLPYPLLADESKTAGDRYDQPTRFAALGSLHDMIGRMPEAVVINAMRNPPLIEHVHRGTLPGDRPTIDDLLGRISELST